VESKFRYGGTCQLESEFVNKLINSAELILATVPSFSMATKATAIGISAATKEKAVRNLLCDSLMIFTDSNEFHGESQNTSDTINST